MMNLTTHTNSRWAELGLNLVVSIAIPAIVLMRYSGEAQLGPVRALIVALTFPVGLGLYDLLVKKQYNFFSIIGFIGVWLTGGIGLLELNPKWLAIKEAGVPLLIGVAIVVSRSTRYPVVMTLLEAVINHDRVHEALQRRGEQEAYHRRVKQVTYMIAASFFVSAALNYILTRIIVTSSPGTAAFNEELGRLTLLSYPAIALPALIILWLAIVWLIYGVEKMTGMGWRSILK